MRLTIQDDSGDGFRMYTSMDGTAITDRRELPIATNQSRTYDIQVLFDGLNFTCNVYMNELLLDSRTFAVSSMRHPRYVWFGGAEGFSGSGQQFYSEIIVAVSDTRNSRLDLIRPSATGALSDWDGPLAALADDDPTTGMTTTAADQDLSAQVEAYTGATNISNVVQVTTSVRGINSPDELDHLIRLSAVDYRSPSFTVPFEKAFQVTDWNQNPATSLPWQASDLSSAEFGFTSRVSA